MGMWWAKLPHFLNTAPLSEDIENTSSIHLPYCTVGVVGTCSTVNLIYSAHFSACSIEMWEWPGDEAGPFTLDGVFTYVLI